MKSKIITILAIVACCLIIILHGIDYGWPVWLIAVTTAAAILGFFIIPRWDTGYFFRAIPLEDLSSKEKAYLYLSLALSCVGIVIIIGDLGIKLILVGAILLILSGILMRHVKKNLPPEE